MYSPENLKGLPGAGLFWLQAMVTAIVYSTRMDLTGFTSAALVT